eukprot:c10651_g1_i1 orf=1-201(+)
MMMVVVVVMKQAAGHNSGRRHKRALQKHDPKPLTFNPDYLLEIHTFMSISPPFIICSLSYRFHVIY